MSAQLGEPSQGAGHMGETELQAAVNETRGLLKSREANDFLDVQLMKANGPAEVRAALQDALVFEDMRSKEDVLPMVKRDLDERIAKGVREYGAPLRMNTGIDALRYAYEEALDLALYLRLELERKKRANRNPGVSA